MDEYDVEALKARYAQLKAAGQGKGSGIPLPLPAMPRELPLDPTRVLHSETIPGGWYWTRMVKRGEALRLANTAGNPGVSVIFWNADDPSERFSHADSIKIQWTTILSTGRLLFSDMGRVMASVIGDSCQAHDTLMGGSTYLSEEAQAGPEPRRNARANFVLAAGKHGLGRRDIPPAITFFAGIATDADGTFSWVDDKVAPGDFVDLRAEMNLLVCVSNTPHPMAPRSDTRPGPVEAIVWQAPPAMKDDICRSATQEAVRGFENTDALFAAPAARPAQ
ncbi:urea amidolyase associated protein UAAP1 [Zavarzinia sp. CC-PAN008]|uniref:urea amidolyase associated protein UAAP1 n=1 Tax=Zavarzinia sp. CC-PAN008 TaxID=3243332 RepID=UPI003F7440C9